MRATALLSKLLGLEQVVVHNFHVEDGALVLAVTPTWHSPRCSGCGRKHQPIHDTHEDRTWRHLDFGGVQVKLRFDLQRVACRKCGVLVAQVPWSVDPVSRYTQDFEDNVAFLAQGTDKTSITRALGITWRSVGRIIGRVVNRLRPEEPLAGLEAIGVDEISYRKHHKYITLVTDHEGKGIVWGGEGKSAESLMAFFDELGEAGCNKIKVVTMDMSAAFISAVRQRVPNATIVFDRFHVQKLANDALDVVRREEWRELRGTPEGSVLKKSRFTLLRNKGDHTASDTVKLKDLEEANRDVYRAFLLKESLRELLGRKQINVVEKMLKEWIAEAKASGLAAFAKLAGTLEKHFEGVVAYVKWNLSNGRVEGLNNKVRVIARRSYGFHSAEAALAMIMLCCTGLALSPVLKLLTP